MADWQRTLNVHVDVPESWLIGDSLPATNDNTAASNAWKEILDDVVGALETMYRYHHVNPIIRPRFDVEWEDAAHQD